MGETIKTATDMISGFSYIHNALNAGIPIREAIRAVRPYVDEMVIVDAESNDGTRELLESMDEVDTILDGKWGNEAGETLKRLHAMHVKCRGEIIWHFEGDEVFDENLGRVVGRVLRIGIQKNLKIPRIQVEQNFQRVRWYIEDVHRIFEKGTVMKQGHTTDMHNVVLGGIEFDFNGLLWDVTNCFRDNFIDRYDQQARLWNHDPKYRMVPLHFTHPIEISREEVEKRLKEPHWTWKHTPLAIPEILKPLVGVTNYRDTL